MTCASVLLLSCMSCKASTPASGTSSPESAPKVKTTKKAQATETKQQQLISVDNTQVTIVTVNSNKMGRGIKNTIVVPKEVVDGTDGKFPVVYLLHGHGGSYVDWQAHTDLSKLADEYGVIFVCPDAQNAWYFDSPVNPKSQYETYVTKELREYVESNYPTMNDTKHRAITGLSMGGHGALWLGWRHPEIYGSCGSLKILE